MVDPRRDPVRPVGLLVKIFPKLSETFILEEVLGLERLGVPLVIYTLAAPTDGIAHPAVGRVRARVVAVPSRPAEDLGGFLAGHLQACVRAPLRYLRALRTAWAEGAEARHDFLRAGWLGGRLRRDGVGHLHAHFIARPAELARHTAALCEVPYSISAHAKDIYLSDPAALRRRMRSARFTVTCTEFNARTLRGIAPDAEVHRMYHGVDAGVFHPSHRLALRDRPQLVPLILSVGRLRAKKGLDTLVEACRALHARGVTFRCEIVGYGEEHARLSALIDGCGLHDRVHLTGKLARDAVLARYARAAVYVQPSRVAADGDRDGIPNVLLEAMATGVPVVATRVSGIPELVQHRRNGLLVEPDDPAALADAVQQLLEQPALAATLTEAGRTSVTAHFDNDRNLRLLLQLLETRHARVPRHALA